MKQKKTRLCLLFIICLVLAVGCLQSQPTQAASTSTVPKPTSKANNILPIATLTPSPFVTQMPEKQYPVFDEKIFLPTILKSGPTLRFSVESNEKIITGQSLFNRLGEINSPYVRLNSRISWRLLQPNGPDDPIDWNKLASFEEELKTLSQLGTKAIIVLNDSPSWSTTKPNHCSPIKAEYFQAYAAFISRLIQRYSAPDFGVHDWELGNEADIDPALGLDINSVYGCWGDISKPDYGGSYYGEMLKVVGPAIRQADPKAVIWMSGLLLDSPNTPATDPEGQKGCPECFLDGVLSSGAASYIDIIPYHLYPVYQNENKDYDLQNSWLSMGGGVKGKAHFLRNVMAKYSVDIPLSLNEIALTCQEVNRGVLSSFCNPPDEQFFNAQADFLIKAFTRAWSIDITLVSWYTLNAPGWRYSGLVESVSNRTTPAYDAYVQFLKRVRDAQYQEEHNYGLDIEAYTFLKNDYLIDIIWSNVNESKVIQIPQSKWIAAYNRNGTPITPSILGSNFEVNIGNSPIYIERYK